MPLADDFDGEEASFEDFDEWPEAPVANEKIRQAPEFSPSFKFPFVPHEQENFDADPFDVSVCSEDAVIGVEKTERRRGRRKPRSPRAVEIEKDNKQKKPASLAKKIRRDKAIQNFQKRRMISEHLQERQKRGPTSPTSDSGSREKKRQVISEHLKKRSSTSPYALRQRVVDKELKKKILSQHLQRTQSPRKQRIIMSPGGKLGDDRRKMLTMHLDQRIRRSTPKPQNSQISAVEMKARKRVIQGFLETRQRRSPDVSNSLVVKIDKAIRISDTSNDNQIEDIDPLCFIESKSPGSKAHERKKKMRSRSRKKPRSRDEETVGSNRSNRSRSSKSSSSSRSRNSLKKRLEVGN